MLSTEVLELLLELLNTLSMPVGHPEFEKRALLAIQAKRELGDALRTAREVMAETAEDLEPCSG